jgi:hypothetical protein
VGSAKKHTQPYRVSAKNLEKPTGADFFSPSTYFDAHERKFRLP